MSKQVKQVDTEVGVVVRPLRFTDHLPAMRSFLELLGFSARVSRRELWVDMVGAAGMVALHAASASSTGAVSGQTGLGFEAPDIDSLVTPLAAAGFGADVHDEAYGRVLVVRAAADGQLWIDEQPTDLYGYHVEKPQPRNGIVAMPLHFDSPTASPVGLVLAALGFAVSEDSHDDWWRVWRGAHGGELALHRPTDDAERGSSQLGFRTSEPLDALARRLREAGFADAVESPDFGGEVTVTDPDGQRVLVLPGRPAQE